MAGYVHSWAAEMGQRYVGVLTDGQSVVAYHEVGGVLQEATRITPAAGRPVCRAGGCAVTAAQRSRICAGCQRRRAEVGLGPDQVELLAVRQYPDRDTGGCVVPGCARTWASGPQQVWRQHADQRWLLGAEPAAVPGVTRWWWRCRPADPVRWPPARANA